MDILKDVHAGTVYWITGLAGSGKTTVGKLFYQKLKSIKPNIIYLDGDDLRMVFGKSAGFTSAERLKLAKSYGHLCKLLADQGINVVCTTISMFWEVHAWNRKHMHHYKEIYLRVPTDVLVERDQKNMYSKALRGEIEHVMGINMPFEEPRSADVIIDNDGTTTPEYIVEFLLKNYIKQVGR